MRLHARLSLLLLLCLGVSPASAIVLFNLDNSANQTDPGAGVPWDSVGRVRTAAGTSTAGSAVYLGNGYVLTANHVSTSSGGFNTIEFGPGMVFPIDFGFTPTQVAAGVDLKVLRLMDHNPVGVDVAMLLAAPDELIASATVIGWGRGRDPSILPGTATVNWGNDVTIAKRWGLNVPRGAIGIPYDSIYTIAGAASGTPAGLGDSEASLATYDSGGGLFQNIGGQWYLIGVNVGVTTANTITFGNDTVIGPPDFLPERASFYARVSSYDGQILTLIPEPSTWAVCAGLAALSLAFRRRR